jgi:hypothetical protein
MKKLTTVVVAALALSILFAAGALAAGQGTVKVDFEPNVGWVNLNTTGSGKLNATAHLDSGLVNEVFSVSIRVRYEDGTIIPWVAVATLRTNEEGIGNVHVPINIDPPPNSGALRRIAFRVRKTGPGGVTYIAVAWDIPLKQTDRDLTR